MGGFACFRLPYEDSFTLVEQQEGDPERLCSVAELSGRSGFVIAPFAVSDRLPVVVIRPDRVRRIPVESQESEGLSLPAFPADSMWRSGSALTEGEMHDRYGLDFANFHAQLLNGRFSKIVLARSREEKHNADPMRLFLTACSLYPRVFVALVSAPVSGTWLTATPEVLLEGRACPDGRGGDFRTMALAGTRNVSEGMRGDSDLDDLSGWSDKNICEQSFVASYVTECIERFTDAFTERGPYTARAGHLLHLRSDFSFHLGDTAHLGDFLQMIHPTPAVCGLPKQETFDFILANESEPRRYYSGFMGMMDPCGSTHLYVTLRSMEICGDRFRLYAGGGLLAESVEEDEWRETEEKMKTMRKCFTEKTR